MQQIPLWAHSHIKSRYLCSPAFSTRADGFVILLTLLVLYLLNDPAEQDIPSLWNITLQDVVNGQEPACVPTQRLLCPWKDSFSWFATTKQRRTGHRKERYVYCLFLLLLLESKVKQTNPELISHLTSLSQRERMLKCICNSSLRLYIQLWNDKCTLSPRFLMSENIFGIQHATQLIK